MRQVPTPCSKSATHGEKCHENLDYVEIMLPTLPILWRKLHTHCKGQDVGCYGENGCTHTPGRGFGPHVVASWAPTDMSVVFYCHTYIEINYAMILHTDRVLILNSQHLDIKLGL